MKRRLLLLTLLAACSQEAAPIDYQGNRVFGRDGMYDRGNGTELPKYSASNPATLPADEAPKYQASTPQYGVAAEAGGVASSDLPPPSAGSAVDNGISASGAPPGEIAVPAGNMPQTQAPFGRGTPAPASTVAAPAAHDMTAVQAESIAPPVAEPITPAPAITQVTSPSAAASNVTKTEPDYYSREMARMDSDETAATKAAPAPASGQPEFIWPVKGDVLSSYGGGNDGIDIKGLKGDPIRAAADGRIVFTGDVKDLGTTAIIDHGGGYLTTYGHAKEWVVKKGDSVVKGQLLGFIGQTGNAASPEVHFSIRKDNKPTDPKQLLVDD